MVIAIKNFPHDGSGLNVGTQRDVPPLALQTLCVISEESLQSRSEENCYR